MVEHTINSYMKSDYNLIFESYSKYVLEAGNNDTQAGAPAAPQQPVQQPTQQVAKEEPVTNQELNDIAKYINSAYDAQMKLLEVLLQKGILDNFSKNDLQNAAESSLVALSRDLVYNAAQNDPQKINAFRNSFHKNIASQIQTPVQQQPVVQQQVPTTQSQS